MKSRIIIPALLLTAALACPAWAATVSGRITYLDLNAHRLMLDSNDMYTIASDVAPADLEVGRLISADVTNRGNERVITKVLKHS